MGWTADKLYGRHGGNWTSPEPRPPAPLPVRARPDVDTVAAHLIADHGLPELVVSAASGPELLGWHDAEHRHRTIPELIGHRHR